MTKEKEEQPIMPESRPLLKRIVSSNRPDVLKFDPMTLEDFLIFNILYAMIIIEILSTLKEGFL